MHLRSKGHPAARAVRHLKESRVELHNIISALNQSSKALVHLPACLAGVTLACTIVYPPLRSPEAPIPATARPIISILEDTAAPHKADPISNTAKKLRNVHCRPEMLTPFYLRLPLNCVGEEEGLPCCSSMCTFSRRAVGLHSYRRNPLAKH